MQASGNPVWNDGDDITSAKLRAIENALKALQVVSALPAVGTQGRIVLLSTDSRLYLDTGIVWRPLFANGDKSLLVGTRFKIEHNTTLDSLDISVI